MRDGYDIYCIERLSEQAHERLSAYEMDDVQCACADYLQSEGYDTLPQRLLAKQFMAQAALLVPTTTNQSQT